ncbi:hypothetical protein BB561_003301 [Smittium simulii]|uniref:Uncharacterized protein n=1 Tax=Smittium simulii TaxID=133385 RepID=A0A2T9YLZ2_9FUNG|nr:hypothetical protein BB561_003301 [Smittium simulii]
MDINMFPTLLPLPRGSLPSFAEPPINTKLSSNTLYKLKLSSGDAETDLDDSSKLPLFKHKYFELINNRPYIITRTSYHFSLLYLKLEELFGKRIKSEFTYSRFIKKNHILSGQYAEMIFNQQNDSIFQLVRVIFFLNSSEKYKNCTPVREFFGPWLSDFASSQEIAEVLTSTQEKMFRIPSMQFSTNDSRFFEPMFNNPEPSQNSLLEKKLTPDSTSKNFTQNLNNDNQTAANGHLSSTSYFSVSPGHYTNLNRQYSILLPTNTSKENLKYNNQSSNSNLQRIDSLLDKKSFKSSDSQPNELSTINVTNDKKSKINKLFSSASRIIRSVSTKNKKISNSIKTDIGQNNSPIQISSPVLLNSSNIRVHPISPIKSDFSLINPKSSINSSKIDYQNQKDNNYKLSLNLNIDRWSYASWDNELQPTSTSISKKFNRMTKKDVLDLLNQQNTKIDEKIDEKINDSRIFNGEYSFPYYFDSYYQLFSESTHEHLPKSQNNDSMSPKINSTGNISVNASSTDNDFTNLQNSDQKNDLLQDYYKYSPIENNNHFLEAKQTYGNNSQLFSFNQKENSLFNNKSQTETQNMVLNNITNLEANLDDFDNYPKNDNKNTPILIKVYENNVLLTSFFEVEKFEVLKLKPQIEKNINRTIASVDPKVKPKFIKIISNISLSYSNNSNLLSENNSQHNSSNNKSRLLPTIQVDVITGFLEEQSFAYKEHQTDNYNIDLIPEIKAETDSVDNKSLNLDKNKDSLQNLKQNFEFNSNDYKSNSNILSKIGSIKTITTQDLENISDSELEESRNDSNDILSKNNSLKNSEENNRTEIPISKSDIKRMYSQKVLQIYGSNLSDTSPKNGTFAQNQPSHKTSKNASRSSSRKLFSSKKQKSNDTLSGLNITLGESNKIKSNFTSKNNSNTAMDLYAQKEHLNQSSDSKVSFYSFINHSSNEKQTRYKSSTKLYDSTTSFKNISADCLSLSKSSLSLKKVSQLSSSSHLSITKSISPQKLSNFNSNSSFEKFETSKTNSPSKVPFLPNYQNINELPIPKIPVSDTNSITFNAYHMETSEPTAKELHAPKPSINILPNVSPNKYLNIIKDKAPDLTKKNSVSPNKDFTDIVKSKLSAFSTNKKSDESSSITKHRSVDANLTRNTSSINNIDSKNKALKQRRSESNFTDKLHSEEINEIKIEKRGLVRAITLKTKNAYSNIKKSKTTREKPSGFKLSSMSLSRKNRSGAKDPDIDITQVKSHFEEYQSAISTTRKFESRRILSTIRDSRERLFYCITTF